MDLNNFIKCPLCQSNPCFTKYKNTYNAYSEYINCDSCIREVNCKEYNISTGDDILNVCRYTVNIVQEDYFLIKIEKHDDQVINIGLNKYYPNVEMSFFDKNHYDLVKKISYPFKDRIFNSEDLTKLVLKIDNYQFLI